MASNKKSQSWILSLASIFLLLCSFDTVDYVIEHSPVYHTQVATPQHRMRLAYVAPNIKQPSSKKAIQQPKYQVEQTYLEQDVFDGAICNLDEWYRYQKKALPEVVQELNGSYAIYRATINRYLYLTVYSSNMTKYFEKELILRIKSVHASYLNNLGETAKRPIKVNLIILPNRATYLTYAARDGFNPSKSRGVYFGHSNIAFVEYKNEETSLKTAVHETVHAINKHLIGVTPRMFNEGTAEYYKDTETTGEIGKYFFGVDTKRLNIEPYNIYLFFNSTEWPSWNTLRLYDSSWAWVNFMMKNTQGYTALMEYIKKEQEDPCSALSIDDIYTALGNNYSSFESDFENQH